jgi:hypothetical protein
VVVGVTIRVAPDPSTVPPHEPVYHNQFADVPKLPPVNDRVEDDPMQIF